MVVHIVLHVASDPSEISPNECVVLVAEMKKHLGRLELETEALGEMLLHAYYVLHGHATAAVGDSCLFCLCACTFFQVTKLFTLLLSVVHL